MQTTKLWHRFCWFCLAVLTAAVLGSILQTQFNLAALVELGVGISWQDWLVTIGKDLISFTPTLAIIIAVEYLFVFPLGTFIARHYPKSNQWVFFVGGFVGLWVALWVVDAIAPMPTLIAATRDWPGTLAIMLAAAFGSWLYARGRQHRDPLKFAGEPL
ncbi:hypothetical protein SAMN06297229_1138 [Pseudidiomarina planktonica]|uniref:Uncharacterized protein n=1 Tax=Pseudidiomarina planktonica TaxID=1323738 RepID=A0A1Y6ERH4_9GAMM|nr:hypothetical protein [Pseudidiomarina planktonica]RUO65454.1 hypothetical protein CWI77_03075 [Pseudidiomarina planktonica]SMQ64926.1 hypothetical protein SAMN06297229_1138 [Pseudidiomarina planktonica]